jgi:dolichyl-diphosphooligosaccharide--protein glycosyltransferase
MNWERNLNSKMNRINKEIVLIIGILLLALTIRLFTYGYEYLLGVDPFHHYRIVEHIVETGEFPNRWHLSRYPDGELIVQPMGLYYLSVLIYKPLSILGFSLIDIFKLTTPIFGVLTLIPVYFITKEVFDKKSALYAVLILSFIPAFTYRTMAGFYRGETFFIFFMVTGLYFYIKSLENPKWSIIAGLAFGLMGLVWNGFIFGFVVLSLALILYSSLAYIKGENKKNAIISYLISITLGVVIIQYLIMIQGHHGGWYLPDVIRYIIPTTIAFSGFILILGYIRPHLSVQLRVLILSGLSAIGLLSAFYFLPEIVEKLILGYGMVKETDPFLQTIGELQSPSIEELWRYFFITSVLFLGGIIVIIREQKVKSIIITAWALAGIYVLTGGFRYMLLGGIPIAIIAASFLNSIDNNKLKIIPTGVLLLLIIFTGIQFATENKPIMSDEWHDSLIFLESQEEGPVLTWWDYGSWVQGVTGFPTITDTVHGQDINRIRETANLLLETNGTVIQKTIKKYGIKYVIVDVNMIGQMHNINKILGTEHQFPLHVYNGKKHVYGISADDYSDFLVVSAINEKIVFLKKENNIQAVKHVYWRESGILKHVEHGNIPTFEGGIYIPEKGFTTHFPDDDFIIYISPDLEESLLTSLLFLDGKGFNNYIQIFKNSQIRIYKIVN